MSHQTTENLYLHYVSEGDVGALAEVFDRVAPNLARLAARIAPDPSQAEDLVQETFLSALERPETYERGRPLLPWLLGILTHRARASRRFVERHLVTETVPAGSLSAASPETAALAQELHATVGSAVEELPEAMRDAVRGMLLDERTTRELAAELAVSPGTLRVRLSRGLERLRGILPASLATALAVTLTHSRGLARARSVIVGEARKLARAKSATLASGPSGLAASLFTKQAAVLAALAAVTGLVLRERVTPPILRPETTTALTAELADPPGAPAARGPVAQGTRLALESPVALDPDPTPATPSEAGYPLSGRVIDSEGHPVPNADVFGWSSQYMKGDADRRTTTDERGAFTLDALGPQFVVSASKLPLVGLRGLRGELQSGVSAQGLELVLAPGETLRGVVLTPDGQPASGAEVEFAGGARSSSLRDQTHVPGVSTFASGGGRAVTDERGRFEIRGMPPTRRTLQVKHAPYLTARSSYTPADSPIQVTLDAGLELSGVVLDAGGRPAEGAAVWFGPFMGNTVPRTTDVAADGGFHLRGMSREQANTPPWIAAVHEGHAVSVLQPVEPGSSGVVRVALDPETPLAGRVVDDNGHGLEGVTVWIEGEREVESFTRFHRRNTWEFRLGLDETKTDATGSFRFHHLYAGRYRVHAQGLDVPELEIVQDVLGGDESIELSMTTEELARVVLTGRVTDAVSGERVEDFEIRVSRPKMDGPPWGPQTPAGYLQGKRYPSSYVDGAYEVRGIEPGELQVRVTAPGYAEQSTELATYVVGEHELDFALTPVRSLILSVVDTEGESSLSGTVQVFDASGAPVLVPRPLGDAHTLVDFDNAPVAMHGLPAEVVTLHIEAAMRERVVQVDLTRPLEGTFEVAIENDTRQRLRFAMLGAKPGVAASEVEDRIASRDFAWIQSRLADGTLYVPGVTVRASFVDTEGHEYAAATVTPLAGGMFRVEERWTAGSMGGESSNEMPFPECDVQVPTRDLDLRVRAEGFADVSLPLPGAGLRDRGEHPLVVLMHRL